VLILDVNVPTASDNPNPYPILHVIPTLLQKYPNLTVLVISMLAEHLLIRAVMEAGASGYILKDDSESIRELGVILQSVASGGVYLSQLAHQQLFKRQPKQGEPALTRRQIEALSLCAAYPDAPIADLASKLGVTNSTIRNLLSGAYLRLGVHNRAAALARARQLGLITPEVSLARLKGPPT
jgi:DNA-binding NarL/FixJ family response regulator